MSTNFSVPDREASEPNHGQQWSAALDQITAALQTLDDSGAPAEVGAFLDLAAHRLREAIDGNDQQSG